MAKLYIAEFAVMSKAQDGTPQIAANPPLAEQTVVVGSEAKSSAFSDQTRFIRVHTDAICSILIDASPTATTSKQRLAADQTEYFGVQPGHKISVIANT